MLNDDEITQLQFAIDAEDTVVVARLLDRLNSKELSELQFYLNSSAFMYACRRSSPDVVRLFLDRGVEPFELPYSDNNELKSAVQHPKHAQEITQLILDWLPEELREDMIVSDWDPDEGDGEEPCFSAMELAAKADNKEVLNLLKTFIS